MVGTYGTVPMMISFCFHVYFVLKEVNWWGIFFCGGRGEREECPHCRGDISRKAVRAMRKGQWGWGKDLYAALPTQEDDGEEGGPVREWYGKGDAKDGDDDETARLV